MHAEEIIVDNVIQHLHLVQAVHYDQIAAEIIHPDRATIAHAREETIIRLNLEVIVMLQNPVATTMLQNRVVTALVPAVTTHAPVETITTRLNPEEITTMHQSQAATITMLQVTDTDMYIVLTAHHLVHIIAPLLPLHFVHITDVRY